MLQYHRFHIVRSYLFIYLFLPRFSLIDAHGCTLWIMYWCLYQVGTSIPCFLSFFHINGGISSDPVFSVQGSPPSSIPTVSWCCLTKDICRGETTACLSAATAARGSNPGGERDAERPLSTDTHKPSVVDVVIWVSIWVSLCRKFAVSVKIPHTKGCRRCSVGECWRVADLLSSEFSNNNVA